MFRRPKQKLISLILLGLLVISVCVYAGDEEVEQDNEHQIEYIYEYESEEIEEYENVTINDFGTVESSITYSSWTHQKIYQFLSLRYGKTTKFKRFKPPKAVGPKGGYTNATTYARPCPQMRTRRDARVKKFLDGDLEDCLFISVYTKNVSSRCPVMFFIHGGHFEEGGAYQYPPNYLLEKDVVLVVAQYRLGPLGFMNTGKKYVGDAALRDLILAMNWTQNYIADFGGDPSNVTMWGYGSGAAIATGLMFSRSVPQGLFHRVIIQSGSIFAPNSFFDGSNIRNSRAIADQAVCKDTDKVDKVNECLKKMSVIRLLKAYNRHKEVCQQRLTKYGGGQLTTNGIFPNRPDELIRNEGSFKRIPVMFGVTKHAGTKFLGDVIWWFRNQFGMQHDRLNYHYMITTIIEFLGIDDTSSVLTGFMTEDLFTKKILKNGTFSDMKDGLVDLCGDIKVKAPVFRAAQLQALRHPNLTYLYTFDFNGDFSYRGNMEDFANCTGAHHFSDLIHLFPYTEFDRIKSPANREMSKVMVNLFTSFAASGIPFCEGVPKWPSMSNAYGPYMHIDTKSYVGKCFLDEYTVITREARKKKGQSLTPIKEKPQSETQQSAPSAGILLPIQQLVNPDIADIAAVIRPPPQYDPLPGYNPAPELISAPQLGQPQYNPPPQYEPVPQYDPAQQFPQSPEFNFVN